MWMICFIMLRRPLCSTRTGTLVPYTTLCRSNTCRDALSRLEQMSGRTGFDLPTKSMRAQIASALHVVIQIERMSDGRRRLVSLQEITGMEGDEIGRASCRERVCQYV